MAYKRAMSYRAVPLAALLDGVQPGDHLQAVALDGFAAELPAAPLLSTQGARAWLAVEDPAQPWPALAKNKPSAGPFYLVWQNPEAAQIGPEQWPFQVVYPAPAGPGGAALPGAAAGGGCQRRGAGGVCGVPEELSGLSPPEWRGGFAVRARSEYSA